MRWYTLFKLYHSRPPFAKNTPTCTCQQKLDTKIKKLDTGI